MKRIIVSTLLALAAMSVALGQSNNERTPNTKCTLTLAQAPEIRGFRLGTRLEQVLARFPGLVIEPPGEFDSRIELVFRDNTSPTLNPRDITPIYDRKAYINRSKFTGFEGVDSIYLKFFDGRISFIQVVYDGTTQWKTTAEFVTRISEALGLPNTWQNKSDGFSPGRLSPPPEPRVERTLECDGFKATANFGYEGQPELSLKDTAADQVKEKRQKEKEEKWRHEEEERRKIFKPLTRL